jgi:gliding motility-associated-like protein
VSTNDLRVIAPLDKLKVLSALDLESQVITPNGDGMHDELQLSYTLHGVAAAGVEAGVYDLAGRLVRRLVSEPRIEGRYIETWNGQIQGRQVPPGTYLVRVTVETDLGTFEKTRTIAIAY